MNHALLTIPGLTLALFAVSPLAAGQQHEGHQHGKAAGKAQDAKSEQAPKRVFDAPQKEGTKAICPVTGETFTIAKDTAHSEHKGKHIYFCCPACKGKFDKDPDKYLKEEKPKGKQAGK